MKLNDVTGNVKSEGVGKALKAACTASCRKILAQIERVKETILAESRDALQTQERLLRLALNEAEALAWQTAYPQLVFPTLATEKVQAVAAWNTRQQAVRGTDRLAA